MPTKTAPTVEELQAQVADLRRRNESLAEENDALGAELANAQELLQQAEEGDDRRSDRARQVVVNHHDDERHPGSQRFCTTAPCPALNELLEGGDL